MQGLKVAYICKAARFFLKTAFVGSIPFVEIWRTSISWRVHSASWVQLKSYLEERVAAPV
jgi:hypothetical protein